jgi:hypothetical protein
MLSSLYALNFSALFFYLGLTCAFDGCQIERPLQGALSHGLDFIGKICNHLDKLLRLGRGNPFQVQAVPQPHEIEEFLKKRHSLDGHVITVQVMAVADMSPAHKDRVGTALERPQNVVRRDGGRAHDSDGPDIGRVLQAADTRKVGCAVSAPVAHKRDYLRLKNILFHLALLFYAG